MQKDIHFYLTYTLARKAGIDKQTALQIAWADQYTDDCTWATEHGIQTQSAKIGNWNDPQIQHTVIVPFHFVPGDRNWIVEPNSDRVQNLVLEGILDPIQFGIALHALQDSFSHQNFTGWSEKHNSCYPWYYIQSGLPNIGHTEMGPAPDVVDYIWTDPRTGIKINNQDRALKCALATYDWLINFASQERHRQSVRLPRVTDADSFKDDLISIFKTPSYDKRKLMLRELSNSKVIYKKIKKDMEKTHRRDFIFAAREHLQILLQSLSCIIPSEDYKK